MWNNAIKIENKANILDLIENSYIRTPNEQ